MDLALPSTRIVSDECTMKRTPSAILGVGGFGRVFRYHNPLDQVSYAIKEIPININDMEKASLALSEIRILAKVSNHANIVRYHHAWVEEYSPPPRSATPSEEEEDEEEEHSSIMNVPHYRVCIQMELCDSSLREYLTRRDGVYVETSRNLFCQILEGCNHLHQSGVVHNDLKPNNIMLRYGDDGRATVRIGDFGLSLRSYDTLKPHHEEGTELYRIEAADAPSSIFDTSRDVYSLGIILFELFCHFYTGMERIVTLRQLRKSRMAPPFFEEEYPLESMMIRTMLSPIKPPVSSIISVYRAEPPIADDAVLICRDIVWGIVCATMDALPESSIT